MDLNFAERKEFEPLPRWSPWVANSGWHWQLYNSTSPDEANTFGIFDGRPSQLIGAQGSNVRIFTEPDGVTDLFSVQSEDGTYAVFYKSGDEIIYLNIIDDGTSGQPNFVGQGPFNTSAFYRADTLHILMASQGRHLFFT